MKIFKVVLGLNTKDEDPNFNWEEYFSTEKKANEYIEKYKKKGKEEFGEEYDDYGIEEIELDKPEDLE